MIQVGDKVLVTVSCGWLQLKDAPAKVTHIDSKLLFDHWTYPIQVELPNAYDENGQTILRVNLKEITKEELV
jgi:hypothetical protein